MKLDSIQLPDNLQWTDEYDVASVLQSARRTLDGTLVTFSRRVVGGRPITLESTADMGWVPRATVDALRALAQVPGATYPLELRGQGFMVMFRHQDGAALSATPLLPYAQPNPGDYYLVTLRLITL